MKNRTKTTFQPQQPFQPYNMQRWNQNNGHMGWNNNGGWNQNTYNGGWNQNTNNWTALPGAPPGWLPKRFRKKKYCWTHGNCNHDSKSCNKQGAGHKENATFENPMGGSSTNCQYCT